jgi:hypothetical protein
MNIIISDGGRCLEWKNGNSIIKKQYQYPVLDYQVSVDGSVVLILEPTEIYAPENAAIYSADGDLVWRLPFTEKSAKGILFDRVGLRDNHLMAIAIVNGRDVGFVVDEKSLSYLSIFEGR